MSLPMLVLMIIRHFTKSQSNMMMLGMREGMEGNPLITLVCVN